MVATRKQLEEERGHLCSSEQWTEELKQVLVGKSKELEKERDRASSAKKAAAKAAEAVQKRVAKAKKVASQT